MRILATTAMSMLLSTTVAFAADTFPTGPVTIIVPYSPGGSTDLVARQLAVELQQMWGQNVIVENRAGAGSMVGTTVLSQAAPDGHTILVNTAAASTAPAVQTLSFDPIADITPIKQLGTSAYVMVAGANVQSDTLSEFVAEAAASPKFFATAGVGSSSHFAAELFLQQSGVSGDIIHFSGGGDANTNLMGGHADIYVSNTASVIPYVRNGQVKALGVLGEERFDLIPDLEASGEIGIEGININAWLGMFGPGGMDPAIVEKIHADVATAMQSDAFKELLEVNFIVPGSISASEFSALYLEEMDLWKALAAERGIEAN